MKAFFLKLVQFVQDDTGALSSMRLLFLLWGLGTFGIWFWISIHTGALVALPWSVTGFISSLTAGKVLQSFTENTPSGTTSITTQTGADFPVTGSVAPVAAPAPVTAPVVASTPVSVTINPAPVAAPAPGTTAIP
jgi:hypothetical protein